MIKSVNIRDSYRFYQQTSERPTDIKTYMHIATGFLSFMMKKILEGFQVQVSNANSMGVFAVSGKKPKISIDEEGNIKGLAVDWKKTNQLWKDSPEAKATKQFVYHTNEHTNGIRYNFVWWKTDMKIGNKYLYSFTFCKPAKRKLSSMIREGKEYLSYN